MLTFSRADFRKFKKVHLSTDIDIAPLVSFFFLSETEFRNPPPTALSWWKKSQLGLHSVFSRPWLWKLEKFSSEVNYHLLTSFIQKLVQLNIRTHWLRNKQTWLLDLIMLYCVKKGWKKGVYECLSHEESTFEDWRLPWKIMKPLNSRKITNINW